MKIISEVVKIFDFESIQVSNGEELRFRLEVNKNSETDIYMGKVFRLETYRLQPTFPQKSGQIPHFQNDALIYLVDEVFNFDKLHGSSVEEVIKKFELEWLAVRGIQ